MFASFKSKRGYWSILEHTTESLAKQYLCHAFILKPDLVTARYVQELHEQARVGRPQIATFHAPVGEMPPSQLRYWKQACEIVALFGPLDGFRISEIGVGYGGLAHALFLASDRRIAAYTLADLPSVESLALKVLKVVLPSEVEKVTLYNRDNSSVAHRAADAGADLCISNWAFSELNAVVAERYLDTIFRSCERGYLTWNHIQPALDFGEVKRRLEARMDASSDPIYVFPEEPLSAACSPPGIKCNNIVVWGAKEQERTRWETVARRAKRECQKEAAASKGAATAQRAEVAAANKTRMARM